MAQVSSVVTGGAAISTASIAEVVSWGAASCHVNMPAGVATTLAALIVAVGHGLYNEYADRKAAKSVAPATPQ